MYRWKSLKELRIRYEYPRDLRLLEHDFRNQNPVGVALVAPGELTFMKAVPFQNRRPDPLLLFRAGSAALHTVEVSQIFGNRDYAGMRSSSRNESTNGLLPVRISMLRSEAREVHRIRSKTLFCGLPVKRETKQYVTSNVFPSS